MFDHKLRMLAFVERWNIAPRLHRQSVAEHSYFVALYSGMLAERLGISADLKLKILDYALRHDMPEYRTGDMPGPGKRAIVDPGLLRTYEIKAMEDVGQTFYNPLDYHEARTVYNIVKAADTIDAYIWITMEVAHGNRMLKRERDIAWDRMGIACCKIGFPNMAHEVQDDCQPFFDGIELAPRLDTDLGPVSTTGEAVHPEDAIPF